MGGGQEKTRPRGSQALIRNAILTHGAGFLEIALRIRFFRRFADALITHGKAAIDEFARVHVGALKLTVSLRSALARSRAGAARTAARYG